MPTHVLTGDGTCTSDLGSNIHSDMPKQEVRHTFCQVFIGSGVFIVLIFSRTADMYRHYEK